MLVAVRDDKMFRVSGHAQGRDAGFGKGVAFVTQEFLKCLPAQSVIDILYFGEIEPLVSPLGIGEVGIEKNERGYLVLLREVEGLVREMERLLGRAGREHDARELAVARRKDKLQLPLALRDRRRARCPGRLPRRGRRPSRRSPRAPGCRGGSPGGRVQRARLRAPPGGL